MPNKLYFINQWNFSENNEREDFYRKTRKFYARRNLKDVQFKIATFNRNFTLNEESKTLGDSEMSQYISENNSPLLDDDDDDDDEDQKIQIKETKEALNDINEENSENLETVQVKKILSFFLTNFVNVNFEKPILDKKRTT